MRAIFRKFRAPSRNGRRQSDSRGPSRPHPAEGRDYHGPLRLMQGVVPPMQTMNRREILPETRNSKTHKFCIGGHEGYLTVGLFDDGRPGEIFIKMSKEGSTLSGLIQGFCRAFSLCLQHGLSVEDAVDRFRGMRFEPLGATTNPDIPECSSILDYVARYLHHEYVGR